MSQEITQEQMKQVIEQLHARVTDLELQVAVLYNALKLAKPDPAAARQQARRVETGMGPILDDNSSFV